MKLTIEITDESTLAAITYNRELYNAENEKPITTDAAFVKFALQEAVLDGWLSRMAAHHRTRLEQAMKGLSPTEMAALLAKL